MMQKTVLWLLLIAAAGVRLAAQDAAGDAKQEPEVADKAKKEPVVATDARKQLVTAWQTHPGDCLKALWLLITHSEPPEKLPNPQPATTEMPLKSPAYAPGQLSTDDAQKKALDALKKAGVTLSLKRVGLDPPETLVGWIIAAVPPNSPTRTDQDKKDQSDQIKNNADAVVGKIYDKDLDALYDVYKARKDQLDPNSVEPFLYLLEAVPSQASVPDYAGDLTALRVAYANPGEDWSLFDLVTQKFEKPK